MMNCPDVLAPTNEDLLSIAYNEETLSPVEQAHLDQCPVCQQRLTTYHIMNHSLLTKLHRSLCPDAFRLSYYCYDQVSVEERQRIAAHILDCPSCGEEVALTRRAMAQFEPFPATPLALGHALRRIFATLVVQQARPVLRGDVWSPTSWPHQYQAGSLDLSLHLSRQATGETMLLGILTSSDPSQTVETLEGLAVELYPAPGPLDASLAQDGQPLLVARVDDVGNLLLQPVPAGEYVLIIRLPDKEVVIENLKIEHG